MSRLDTLSGASFRPAQQTQTASSAAEKVAAKILDSGDGQNRFQRDGFDVRPRQHRCDPGFYSCNAVYPDPSKPKHDPGFYSCNARIPDPSEPPQDPGLYSCSARVPASIVDLIKDLEK